MGGVDARSGAADRLRSLLSAALARFRWGRGANYNYERQTPVLDNLPYLQCLSASVAAKLRTVLIQFERDETLGSWTTCARLI